MSEADAIKLLEACQRVLYLREKRCTNEIQIAKVTKDGFEAGVPYTIDTKWDFKAYINDTNEKFRAIRVKY